MNHRWCPDIAGEQISVLFLPFLQSSVCGLLFSHRSSPYTHILVFTVAVRMLRHRVDDRREDVQHEDHGRRQARHEKNCSRTGSPVPQKPRAERRSGGGVWCELSRVFADKRQRCPETAFTSLGRNKRGRQSHMTHTYLHTYTLTHTHAQGQFWQFTDGPPLPNGECAISIFELCGVFINAMHAAKLIQVRAKGCWYLNVHISCLWAFATFLLVGNVLVWMSLQLQKQKNKL